MLDQTNTPRPDDNHFNDLSAPLAPLSPLNLPSPFDYEIGTPVHLTLEDDRKLIGQVATPIQVGFITLHDVYDLADRRQPPIPQASYRVDTIKGIETAQSNRYYTITSEE